jgi:AcrR family transcriptional regulator
MFVSSTIHAMATTDRSRSTRDRPAKPPLSLELIVDTALAITRAEGLAAVTMRRLATELDTGAASLYVYVRNRDALMRAMVNRAIGAVPVVVPDPSRWRDQVYELLDGFRVVFEAHPGMATMLGGPPTAESEFAADDGLDDNTLASMENLLGLMGAGGIDGQQAAWACDALLLIVTATATEADSRRAAGMNSESDFADIVERLHSTFSSLPVDRYPLIVGHATELVTGDGDTRFRFAIDTFLDGLVVRCAHD